MRTTSCPSIWMWHKVWGRLRVPHHENAIDKQIAATGARLLNLSLPAR